MRPQTKQPLTVQEQYLRKHKSHHRQVSFLRFFLLGIFLLLWEVSADLDWIDSFFFSSPHRVILCLGELWTERSLPMHIGITLLETILSFLLVFFVSLLLSTLLWFSRQLSEILEPYLVLLNSLPKSALAPLFIVWLGTGINTIIIAGISVAVFGSIISFYTAFHQVDPEKEILIRTLGGNRRDIFFKVVLSMTISGALAGLAGVTYYLGYVGSIQPKVLISTGFDAIAVSLLGNNNPFGIVFSTMLITLISKGSTYMKSAAGVDAEIASVITGIILLFSACNAYIKWKMERNRREKTNKTKEDK